MKSMEEYIDVFIKSYEIAIGNSYRDALLEELLKNSLP